jgi:radical SAM enzyme (TIGR01210 family)
MKDFRGEINKIIHDIKAASGWRPGETKFDAETMALVSDNVACLDGKAVRRKILVFRSNGCRWAKRQGCSMCGYFQETTGEQGIIKAGNYITQLRRELDRTNFAEYPVVCLFTAGSFLDDWEFPWESAQEVFRLLGQQKDLKKVVIESCAEYVEEEKVARLRDLIGDKIVEVGIGLESSDRYILRNCVNKDFTLDQYNEAITVLNKYFRVLSYILVKPPFLTEREALDLAIQTGRYAFDQGSHAISFEPMYVEPHTLVDSLYRKGYGYKDETYRPPWLWTVFEAVRTLKNDPRYADREIRVGYSDELPAPHHVSRNCDLCTDEAYRRIQRYAQTYDFRILDEFQCVCQLDWKATLEAPGDTLALEDRIGQFVSAYWADKRQLTCLSV